MRRHRVLGRRYVVPARVGGGCEDAFVNQAISLLDLLPLGLRQMLYLGQVGADGVGEIAELKRQQLRVRQPDYRRSRHLGQRPAVDEIGVGEMRVPVKVVVDGVVDAAILSFSAKARD